MIRLSCILNNSHLVGTVSVNSVNQIPIGIFHVLEADVAQDTSVVEQNIDATEGFDSGVDDRLAIFDAVVVGNGFPTSGTNFLDDIICSLRSSQSQSSVILMEHRRTFPDFPSPL